ncbi:MAG: hypothetical protein AB7G21_11275 [Dehalococcoidia bacterium]
MLFNLFPFIAFGVVFLVIGLLLWRRWPEVRAEHARWSRGERIATTIGLICLAAQALITLGTIALERYFTAITPMSSFLTAGWIAALGTRIVLTQRRKARERARSS